MPRLIAHLNYGTGGIVHQDDALDLAIAQQLQEASIRDLLTPHRRQDEGIICRVLQLGPQLT